MFHRAVLGKHMNDNYEYIFCGVRVLDVWLYLYDLVFIGKQGS